MEKQAQLDAALIAAIKEGADIETVRTLLDDGADVNTCDAEGYSALIIATEEGYGEIAKLLIERAADIHAIDPRGERTALIFAAFWSPPDVVRCLVEHGADVNAQECYGLTALMGTARNGDIDSMKLLIEHGADVNLGHSFEGETTLMYAVQAGHLQWG